MCCQFSYHSDDTDIVADDGTGVSWISASDGTAEDAGARDGDAETAGAAETGAADACDAVHLPTGRLGTQYTYPQVGLTHSTATHR